jgi:HEAT repeat protein
MLRRSGLLVTGVFIGAATGFLTDAVKKYLTDLPMPKTHVWALAAAVALVVLLFDWALLDKDRPLRATWWYWRVFYLKDVVAELGRQLNLQGRDFGLLPEIVEIIESRTRVPLGAKLLPGLRARQKAGHRFLVIGEPGAGKTILTLQIVHKLADEAKWRFWRPMPVLLAMSGYRDGTLDSFTKQQIELATEGDGGKVLSDGFDRLMKRRRFVFILDALDELPEAQIKRLPADLANWSKPGRGDPTFLATARAREIHPDQLQLESLRVFNLVELSDESARALIRTYGAPERSQEIYADLEKHGVLDRGGLGRNPFWLQAILRAQIYDKGRALILDSSVSKLLLREWNKPDAKRGWAKVEEREDQLRHTKCALGWLAYQMLASNRVAVSHDEARLLVEDATKRLGLSKPTAADVLGLGRDALLLEYVGADIRFRHQILQSFFAAHALIEELGLLDSLVASDAGLPYRWWDALLLVNEFNEQHSRDLHEKLLTTVFDDRKDPARIMLAAGLLVSIDRYIYGGFQKIKDAVVGQFVRGEEAVVLASLRAIAAVSPPALVSILELVIGDDPDTGGPDNREQHPSHQEIEAKAAAFLTQIIESEIQAGTAGRTLSALFREYRTAPLAGRAAVLIGPAGSDALLSAFATTNSAELAKALGQARIQAAVPALVRVAKGELRPATARGKTRIDLMLDPAAAGFALLETAAIEALGKIGSSDGIPALLALARSDEPLEEMGAVEALAEIGVAAIPALLSLVNSGGIASFGISKRIARMGPAAIPQLLVGLDGSDEEVRRAAVLALGEIGDSSVASAVAKHVTDLVFPNQVPDVLASFGTVGASAIVDILLTKPDLPALNRDYLCNAFEKISLAGIPPLVAALPTANPDQREFLVRALGKTQAPEAAPYLLPLVNHADESTRRAAVRALGDLHDVEYARVITQALKEHPSVLLQVDGFIALAQLDIEPAKEWMLNALGNGIPELGAEKSGRIQKYLAAGAFQINLVAAIPILEKLIAQNGPKDSSIFESMLKGLQTK